MSTTTAYLGHDVVDADHNVVGSITDVIYDHDEETPSWLVVKPGALHAERYVPIERSYTDTRGNLVVPFDKKMVRHAPKAGDHVLTADVQALAEEHYDVGKH